MTMAPNKQTKMAERRMPRTLTRSGLDFRTIALFSTMVGGLVANFTGAVAGWVPLPLSVIVSVPS